jgi:hypothetical protein
VSEGLLGDGGKFPAQIQNVVELIERRGIIMGGRKYQ